MSEGKQQETIWLQGIDACQGHVKGHCFNSIDSLILTNSLSNEYAHVKRKLCKLRSYINKTLYEMRYDVACYPI